MRHAGSQRCKQANTGGVCMSEVVMVEGEQVEVFTAPLVGSTIGSPLNRVKLLSRKNRDRLLLLWVLMMLEAHLRS